MRGVTPNRLAIWSWGRVVAVGMVITIFRGAFWEAPYRRRIPVAPVWIRVVIQPI